MVLKIEQNPGSRFRYLISLISLTFLRNCRLQKTRDCDGVPLTRFPSPTISMAVLWEEK